MKPLAKLGLAASIVVGLAPSAHAEQVRRADAATQRVLADRVVAVVGDRFILASELDERVAVLVKFGDETPEKPDARWKAEARVALLRAMIDETLVLRDLEYRKITVTEADILRAMANAAERAKRTEADLFAEATAKGLTREEYLGEIRRWVTTSRWTREVVIPRLDPKIASDPKMFEPGIEVRRREILDDLRRRTFIEVRQ